MAADDDFDFCVLESSRGRQPDGGRDCSDEFLPEGERLSDAERAATRAHKKSGGFQPDWSIPEGAATTPRRPR